MFGIPGKEERMAQLQQTAGELEMKFTEKDEYGMIALLRDFKLFEPGGRKAITNILSQSSPLLENKVNIFDYRYTVSTGKSSHSFDQTVFFLQSKLLSMPEMRLKPEHFFHRIGTWLGLVQDIDFDEYPKFSENYLLQGEDENQVRNTMKKDEVIRFFSFEKDWCLESVGFYLIFYQHNRLMKPHEIKEFHQRGMMLFQQFKTAEWP